ncbi:hypothetical protein G7047_14730 [Diaphorobacter sp. HDW4A]|uniref:hypothetical protein n=1 Tax=Diaphorobacter sp. HDW4A TaxID=2714924 RepID=UPI001408ACD1|nr:hypothetical protein [Diaphorobacter sp. HDW4A]QIL81011.1 hypothetical protein G7047_14730 [Diaphorobacter sp. HDW4A]
MSAVLEKPKAVRATPKPAPHSPAALAPSPTKVSSTHAWELGDKETFASIVWRRVDEAEAAIRAHAEEADNTAAYGVLAIIYSAIDLLVLMHESPTTDDCTRVSVCLEHAIGIMRYIAKVEADLLTDAGLTLLIVAKSILDEGRKGL